MNDINDITNPVKKKKGRILKILLIVLIIILSLSGYAAYYAYNLIYKPNVKLPASDEPYYLYIKTGSTFENVLATLENEDILINQQSFKDLALRKNYPSKVKAGRYKIRNGISNNELINLLRSGKQDPVNLTFNNIRTREQLIRQVSKQIEADSLSLAELFNDRALYEPWGFNQDNINTMFIPNTYEFYWNTSAISFFERMHNEYLKFWTESRKNKASAINLSPIKVTILASIVWQETKKADEMSRVAGVYVNRLQKGMPLQADPTVVYAIGDFNIKRVLKRHLEFDSPYNTYKNTGLPPGPICLPDPITIDKTLEYENHEYLFFCAREDFSGYHVFAKTHAQHQQNAVRYHQALNKRNIKK